MVPSTTSEKMNAVITSVPTKKSPRGKNTSAAATTPTVPAMVTMSGLIPTRSSPCAVGVSTRVKKARAYRLSIAVPDPRLAPTAVARPPRRTTAPPHAAGV